MILVTGATGYVGRHLLRRLAGRGDRLRCIVRPTSDPSEAAALGVEIRMGDLERPEELAAAFDGVDRLLHAAHVALAPGLAAVAGGVKHAVVFSSMRRFSQVADASVQAVTAAEQTLGRVAPMWTVLRPTMIYGPGDDRNISRLAAHLRRFGLLPLFGDGQALQQPVWVEDVVQAAVTALERPQVAGRHYALAGAAALPYAQLVDAVGRAVGRRPRQVRLPLGMMLAGLRLAGVLGLRPGIDAAQLRRLQEDKSCSIEAARRDLDFDPVDLPTGLARIYGQGV